MVDTETGELVERRLEHESGEARAFYAGLKGAVRVGIEATGHTAWFEALLAELGHELWMAMRRRFAPPGAHTSRALRCVGFAANGMRQRTVFHFFTASRSEFRKTMLFGRGFGENIATLVLACAA